MEYKNIPGVPDFRSTVLEEKSSRYCVLIPVINEGIRIRDELLRGQKAKIPSQVDIIICDGGSVDGSMEENHLRMLQVNALLTKEGAGKQGAQLRMGIWWALERGYRGIITIDGNNKDSIEDIPVFIQRLEEGYDFIQGSRFAPGGQALNTPLFRYLSLKLVHAPIISMTAHYRFTDTTNAYRAYSRKYLEHPQVQPLRDIFVTYELLAYLSVRASQLGMRVCEIPVRREYPSEGKIPTKISTFRGNFALLKILILNMFGRYNPCVIK